VLPNLCRITSEDRPATVAAVAAWNTATTGGLFHLSVAPSLRELPTPMRLPDEVMVFPYCLGCTCAPFPGPTCRRPARRRHGRVSAARRSAGESFNLRPAQSPCVPWAVATWVSLAQACCAKWAGVWNRPKRLFSLSLFSNCFEWIQISSV
jgi:hypothetical protein